MNLDQAKAQENPIVWSDLESVLGSHRDWDFFRNQSILITGGAGLLASYLVRSLLLANARLNLQLSLTCLLRSKQNQPFRLLPWLGDPCLKLIYGDAESYPYADLSPHSIIIHAASGATPSAYNANPVGILLPNCVGTAHLCEQARNWGSERFLFFSTGEVYGIVNKEHFDELDFGYLDPNVVRSCYAESKRMGETICHAYSHQFALPTTSARIFHTYGPQMNLDDGRVFADFVRDALHGQPIRLAGSGTALRCFCYIRDATNAFLQLLVKGENGQAYNLANPQAETSILELAQLISRLVDPVLDVQFVDPEKAKPGYMPSPVTRSLPNINKLKTLGWQPETDLSMGFRRTLLSYQN